MLRLTLDPVHPDADGIQRIADVLRDGGVVAYPTDTLYGLAVDPRNDRAVDRLFELKGRDERSAIPLIASSLEQALEACALGPVHLRLAAAFWPGPLTLVGEAGPAVSRRILAGANTVAVRVPAHAVARGIARAVGFCITSTSANEAGGAPASTPADVTAAFGDRLDALVEAGPAPGGLPSTIVAVRDGAPVLVRAGAIAWERVLESLQ